MCNETVHDSLAALKLFPNWFVTRFVTAFYADENILYFNRDFGNVIFTCNKMGILNIDLNNINLENNFDEDESDTIILIRILTWHTKFEKRKAPNYHKLALSLAKSLCLGENKAKTRAHFDHGIRH